MDRIKQLLFEEKPDWIGSKIRAFLLDKPAFLLTLLYICISGFGLLFEVVLFSTYRIDVLDYSETADFFLAAFKRPRAFLALSALIALFVSYWTFAKYVKRMKRDWIRSLLFVFVWIGLLRREIIMPIAAISFVIIYWNAAYYEAHRLVFREDTIVTITTRFNEAQEFRLIPVGATEKFLFGIEYTTKLAAKRKDVKPKDAMPILHAIPFSNITRITYKEATLSRLSNP